MEVRQCDYEELIVKTMNNHVGDEQYYNCPKCLNRGYNYKFRDGQLYSVICDCIAVRKSNKLLVESGLMENIEKSTFNNFKATENWQIGIKERCFEFVNNFSIGKSICILGQSGAGKTHLCTAICGELIKKGYSLRYVLWRDLVSEVQSNTYNNDVLSQVFNRIKAVDVIYIDDMFKLISCNSAQRTKELEIAFKILNDVEIMKKSIIVSSEYTLNEIKVLDEAIAGRIVKATTSRYLIQIAKNEEKNYRFKNLEMF